MPSRVVAVGPVELNRDTPEEDVAALVDAVREMPDRRDSLVALLPERIDMYAGRSTNATIRMRGYILAAFEQVGLPHAALPYVLEELQNGRDAYLVAAAARALRGYDHPSPELVPYVFQAIANIRYIDDAVSFDRYKPTWPAPRATTALTEIFTSFAWLGVHARPALSDLESLYDYRHEFSASARSALAHAIETIRSSASPAESNECCCAGPDLLDVTARPSSESVPSDVMLQDQDGRSATYAEFFHHSPAIVVFFYTRCDNPNKCSLTITNFAKLQQAMADGGVIGKLKLAAISYDPDYDRPERLKAYGLNRGVVFGESARFFRTLSGFATLQDYFQLGVNFGDVLVNRHTIELFILDESGRIVDTHTRLRWDHRDVLDRALKLLGSSAGQLHPATHRQTDSDQGSPTRSPPPAD